MKNLEFGDFLVNITKIGIVIERKSNGCKFEMMEDEIIPFVNATIGLYQAVLASQENELKKKL